MITQCTKKIDIFNIIYFLKFLKCIHIIERIQYIDIENYVNKKIKKNRL